MVDAMLSVALVVAIGVALKFRRDAYHARADAELWHEVSDGYERMFHEGQGQVAQLLEEREVYASERRARLN